MKYDPRIRCSTWPAYSLLVLAACGGNTAGTASPTNSEPAASSGANSETPRATIAVDAGSPDDASNASATTTTTSSTPQEDIAALGAVHAPPIELTQAPDEPVRLQFVGSPERADAAWVVSAEQRLPVQGWPAGVRVLGGAVTPQNRNAYVLVETLGESGQVAGQKAVVEVDTAYGAMANGTDVSTVFGAQTLDDLRARTAAPRAEVPDADAPCRAIARAARSAAGLASIVAADGLDVYTEIQPRVYTSRHLAAAQVRAMPAGPERAAMLASAAYASAEGGVSSPAPVCWIGGNVAEFSLDHGAPRLRTLPVTRIAPARTTPAPTAVQSVSAGEISDETRAAFRARWGSQATPLAQAPLGASGGTVAVGTAVLHSDADRVVVEMVNEAGRPRYFDTLDGFNGSAMPTAESIRFADVNGDGRTDAFLLLSSVQGGDANHDVRTAVAVVTPAPSLAPADWYAETDYSFAMAAFDAPDVDSALRAATALPARGVDARAACRLFRTLRGVPALRAASTGDARVGDIGGFESPIFSTTWQPLAAFAPQDAASLAVRFPDASECRALHCTPGRAFCEEGDPWEHRRPGPPPTRRMFWFDTQGGTLKLRGLSYYEST